MLVDSDAMGLYASKLLLESGNEELKQRLELYQIFQRLFEHHRELLDELLNLESTGIKSRPAATTPYVEGVIEPQHSYLMTNLLTGSTQRLEQAQQTWVLGRDYQAAHLVIEDSRVSRCHAALHYIQADGFYLVDLGSRNGSFVNGEFVSQQRQLHDGDRIRLGSFTFIFYQCQQTKHLPNLPDHVLQTIQQTIDQRSVSSPVLAQEGMVTQNYDPSQAEGDYLAEMHLPHLLDDTARFSRSY